MDTVKSPKNDQISFIDKFFVPKNSIEEFTKKMNENREFISKLTGYQSGEVYMQYDEEGNLILITIAHWENEHYLNLAKNAVHAEFKRVGFNPQEFYQRLGIKMERGIYRMIVTSN